MPYFDDSRAHRRASRVASALADYARPEDANGPSKKPVDGDIWYATMFLYPNHWEAGRGGALTLPNAPYRTFPFRALLGQAKDSIISIVILFLLYCAVWPPFSGSPAHAGDAL
ncbi:hypothetical protein ABL78_1518 [Leptomonas seymouri]|uniref:Uncharacterized protein n=1 Tax=Leptomonas seymouri TaxID=5684 RepID=A0A0N1I7B8_LEPSE|nr:hypothetical protein ABL78_1518 [Leptomonas seymouri]|eukprot:KPI89392.1 hypothetical protein ABL78_1518 [Leptomonas seymouri]